MGISLENFTIISDIGGYRFHISLEDCFNPSYSLTYNVYRVMGELHGDKVIEREMGKLDTDSRDFLGLSAFVSKYGRGLEQVIFGKECAMEVYNGLVVFKFNRLSGLDKTIINGYKLRDESEEFILKEKDLRRNKRFFDSSEKRGIKKDLVSIEREKFLYKESLKDGIKLRDIFNTMIMSMKSVDYDNAVGDNFEYLRRIGARTYLDIKYFDNVVMNVIYTVNDRVIVVFMKKDTSEEFIDDYSENVRGLDFELWNMLDLRYKDINLSI